MEFSLTYRGILHSNGNSRHKHQIRKHFHRQLKLLWDQYPLKMYRNYLHEQNPSPKDDELWVSLVFPLEEYRFVPLVTQELFLVAELNIILMRPEQHGEIITQAGDIDNRLKTLFDALQMPKPNQLEEKQQPEADEEPFFCLLEDDNLITKVAVTTEQLLEPVEDDSEVLLIIQVKTKKTTTTVKNLQFS
jgi:hypothetical protein